MAACPLLLLGAAPDLVIDLLSSKPEQSTIYYQYAAGIVPFVVAASVLGAARMRRDPRRLVRSVLVIMTCLAVVSPLAYAAANLDRVGPSNPVHAATRQALQLVPPTAAVSASQSLGAYLSTRRSISVFPHVRGADWVVVGETRSGYDHPKAYWAALAGLKASPSWKLVYSSHGITVLRRVAAAQ